MVLSRSAQAEVIEEADIEYVPIASKNRDRLYQIKIQKDSFNGKAVERKELCHKELGLRIQRIQITANSLLGCMAWLSSQHILEQPVRLTTYFS